MAEKRAEKKKAKIFCVFLGNRAFRRVSQVGTLAASTKSESARTRGSRLALVGALSAALLGLGLATLSVLWTFSKPRLNSAETIDFGLEALAATCPPELADGLRYAESLLQELAARHGVTAELYNIAAQALHTFGRSEAAAVQWKESLKLDPNCLPALCGLAEFYAGQGEGEEAVHYFRRAWEIEPQETTHPLKLAQELLRQARSDKVIALLEPLSQEHPCNVAVLALLGQAYVQAKQFDKACQVLERAIYLAPGLTNSYYALAQAQVALGRSQEAKENLKIFQMLKDRDEEAHRQYLRIHDDRRDALRYLAELFTRIAAAYLAGGDPQKGEHILLTARKFSPESNPPLEVLAWLYHRQGRKAECLRTLEELASRKDYLPGQLLCASLFEELAMLPQAEEAYRRAIELAPHQGPGYVALAMFFLRHNRNLPEAEALALRAFDLEPTPENLELYAAVCFSLGKAQEAQTAQQMAAILATEAALQRRAMTPKAKGD